MARGTTGQLCTRGLQHHASLLGRPDPFGASHRRRRLDACGRPGGPCRGQIAHCKMPRYIRFVSEFPLTVAGTRKECLIRQQIEAELGLFRGWPA